MNNPELTAGKVWVKRKREEWPPALKLILAFIVGLVALSPAILGIYWELLLP
jgi:hypothetical protein